MPSQLLEVSLALSEGSLQWHVLLLRVDPRAVQCQPETNRTEVITSFLCQGIRHFQNFEEKPF